MIDQYKDQIAQLKLENMNLYKKLRYVSVNGPQSDDKKDSTLSKSRLHALRFPPS
jgi:hypothetical protein